MKRGIITRIDQFIELDIANGLLEQVKHTDQGKRPIRIDRNTIIMVDGALTNEQVQQRVAAFKSARGSRFACL